MNARQHSSIKKDAPFGASFFSFENSGLNPLSNKFDIPFKPRYIHALFVLVRALRADYL